MLLARRRLRGTGEARVRWDDAAAREALVYALARDANEIVAALDGRTLTPRGPRGGQAGRDGGRAGSRAPPRRQVPDRAPRGPGPRDLGRRSGSSPWAQDGGARLRRLQGHVAIDPDSELIIATAVTPGNAADGSTAATLLADVLPAATDDAAAAAVTPRRSHRGDERDGRRPSKSSVMRRTGPRRSSTSSRLLASSPT